MIDILKLIGKGVKDDPEIRDIERHGDRLLLFTTDGGVYAIQSYFEGRTGGEKKKPPKR